MGSKDDRGHVPVLVDDVVRLLVSRLDGAYCDLTAGAGGHLRALSLVLGSSARLYGVDRDPSAVAAARANLADVPQAVTIINSIYSETEAVAAAFDDTHLDGILLDLGLSSLQLDDPERGFTFRFEGPLDMRFDPSAGGANAADLVNTSTEKALADMLFRYGEESRARRLAKQLVRERRQRMILTTADLKRVVESIVPPPQRTKTLARVFQALRIAVNRELEHLEQTLPKLLSLLRPGGRLAVISYHSLEDRMVKQFFAREAKGCLCPREVPVCVCGHVPQVTILTRRPITPSEEEIRVNSRARSAKLRVAEKVGA